MRPLVAVFAHWLHLLSLCVWLGGIVVWGAVGAPSVFAEVRAREGPATAGPLHAFAGAAVTRGFERLGVLTLVAGAAMFFSGLAYARLAALCRVRATVRSVVTLGALGVAAWTALWLMPEMARAAGDPDRFQPLHHLSRHAFQAQAVLLAGAALLTGWLDLAPPGFGHVGESRAAAASPAAVGNSTA
jgi:hypothetical protein